MNNLTLHVLCYFNFIYTADKQSDSIDSIHFTRFRSFTFSTITPARVIRHSVPKQYILGISHLVKCYKTVLEVTKESLGGKGIRLLTSSSPVVTAGSVLGLLLEASDVRH